MKKAFDLVIAASHPVVACHRVHGQRVLPGLAYIDLLGTIARDGLHLDSFATTLRDLVIYRPLIVPDDGDAALTIGVSALDGGGYAIEVAPAGAHDDPYCAAELHAVQAQAREPDLDLAALTEAPQTRIDLAAVYGRARERGLVHEALMRADGVARRFDWGCLIELRVPEAFRGALPGTTFHPTLIDGAAVASSVLENALRTADAPEDAGELLYLPLHYGTFRARAPLDGACLARVRLDRIEIANDIRKLDIDFYDEAGRWLASLGELTGKRVRDWNGAQLAARHAAPVPIPAPAPAPREPADGRRRAEAFESDLRRVFADHLGVAPAQLDMRRGFYDMGLSSMQMLTILKDIERVLSRRLNPTLLFEYNTIDELLAHFSEHGAAAEPSTNPSTAQSAAPELAPVDAAFPVSVLTLPEPARYRFEASEPQLADHLVDGKPALMGITYPCLALHVCETEGHAYPLALRDVRFSGGPLRLEAGQYVDVEVRLDKRAETAGAKPFTAWHQLGGATHWSMGCEGQVVPATGTEPPALDWPLHSGARELSREEIEHWFETVPAFTIGPTLRSIHRAFALDDGGFVSEVDLDHKRHPLGLPLDPLLLNACYQFKLNAAGGLTSIAAAARSEAPTFLPLLIERLTLWRPMTARAIVVTRPRRVNAGFLTLDAAIYDNAKRCVATVENASLRQIAATPERGDQVASAVAQARTTSADRRGVEVAVVGMAGRFPQSRDLDAFWDNLSDGRDCITEIPLERWDWRDYYSPGREPGTMSSKWGGFIDEADAFDPLFFQISPREAEVMDPLERLFVQHCWSAMEDAGYTREALRAARAEGGANGRVGIWAGVMGQEYPLFALDGPERMGLGGGTSSVATRMAYVCDFSGPAMAVDTMCSSSLVALGMACDALASGAVDAAFAGGVNLSLHPSKYLMLSRGQFISSKGHCESFGEGGDGYIPGEGVGVLMLKRLADAERDGDMIHGLIRAVAVNHGGRASGYTVPNPAAQARVIRAAIEQAGVAPGEISYVEAHGTGTKLGDPIEIAGLARAFGSDGAAAPAAGTCRVGSVKSNIGHCEGAAGIAGVIKVLLQMRHRTLVPSLHSRVLNPAIDFAATPFTVNQTLTPWPDTGPDGVPLPRVAGISSFGAGGVNAHAIVQAYAMPDDIAAPRVDADWLIVLSARERSRLPLIAANLLAAIERRGLDDRALPRIAYTLQVGREPMEYRAATVIHTLDELKERLRAFAADGQGELWLAGAASAHREAVALYADGDAQALLGVWLDKGNLAALARVWVMGVTPDWRRLYRPENGFMALPRRISLPAYPFRSDRYWIPRAGAAGHAAPSDARGAARAQASAADAPLMPQSDAASGSGPATAARAAVHHADLFALDWQLCEPGEPALPARYDNRAGFVLILTTAATRALAERVAALRPGARIADIDRLADDIEMLCRPNGHALAFVLDLTALDTAHVRCRADAITRWLPGMQRLVERVRQGGVRLLGVTRELEAFARGGSGASAPHAALIACLYRSLGFEYPRLKSGHLDIDLQDEAAELPHRLLGVLEAGTLEPRACLRGGRTYVPRMVPLPAQPAGAPFALPAEHALWITGGTRGLGLLCARHLFEHYGVRKLVLSGRERLPNATRWAEILANPDAFDISAGVRAKLEALHALQRQGAQVLTLDVDLTDERAMDQARETIVRELGPIGAVVHCAGLGDANPAWIRKDPLDVRAVLAPKTAGLDGLCRVVRGQPLSRFVVYSSVCAALPQLAAGQIDYAMANAYMDALAQHSRELEIISLQWPSWIETGMGAMETDIYRATGLVGLSDSDGVALLDRALSLTGPAVVMPALVDPTYWRDGMAPARAAPPIAPPEGAPEPREPVVRAAPAQLSATAAHTEPVLDAQRLAALAQAWLGELFMAELKVSADDFDARVDFSAYGLDSILMAQILRTINVALHADLAPSLILEHPNLAALSAWLATNEAAALGAYFARSETDEGGTARASEGAAHRAPAVTHGTRTSTKTRAAFGGAADDEIVVVGMSARFPGAPSLAEYWRLLLEGRSAFARMSRVADGTAGERFVGALGHDGRFERKTFHIPVADFNAMDPQALIVLEECLSLFAHAGYRLDEIKGSETGVFLGGRARPSLDPRALQAARNPIVVAGQNYLAANVSHFFDLSGPSLVLDAACSSALVAMHLAAQALRGGEIDAALVGGVHLHDAQHTHAIFEQRKLLSASDCFHLFDERADGIILSEGVGLVLLKTAARARSDGDTVYARIAALSCNNDGRTAGPATPNLERQSALMRRVLAQSGLAAGQIGYIETNGSGSKVTDLLELKAIDAVYGRQAADAGMNGQRPPCALGSIKPNIGHPLCAEGIASFIKAVLMLHHGRLVPFMSGQQALRHFDLAATPFHFPRDVSALSGTQAIALNCFADGGTNAHAILRRAPESADVPRHAPLAPPIFEREQQAARAPSPSVQPARASREATMIWEQYQ